jgi:hypothetical protein
MGWRSGDSACVGQEFDKPYLVITDLYIISHCNLVIFQSQSSLLQVSNIDQDFPFRVIAAESLNGLCSCVLGWDSIFYSEHVGNEC